MRGLSKFSLGCVLFTITAALVANAATDARFGLVGTGGKAFAQKFGLTYYALEGNYPGSGNIFSSVDPANDPAAGYKVLRKVAKLNVRNDSLGQTNVEFQTALNNFGSAVFNWYVNPSGPSKPVFTWYAPSATNLSAAESLQIITTIRREKAHTPAITGTVWEIGNEPNLFPALLPANYAAVFTRYYKIIKQEDPTAKVAMGPVFVREVAMDLLPRMQEIITQSLIDKGVGQPGQPVFDSVNKDLWTAYSSRTLNLGTVDYFAQTLAALDTSVHPDVISLHVYPFEDRLPILDEAQTAKVLDSLADSLGARLQTRSPNVPVWITEFGNINSGYTDEQVASQASSLIDVFVAKSRFQNWFYYKATGFDAQVVGLPGLASPLTRLAKDESFDPVDGNFACGQLNAAGKMYYLRANGEECLEKVGFAAASSFTGFVGSPATPSVRLSRAEVDTVKVDVVWSGGTIQTSGYTQIPSPTVVFAPGDTSKTVTLMWKSGSSAGNVTLKLRNPVNATISADSTLIATYNPEVAVLPGLPGTSLSLDPARAALIFSGPTATDLSIRILDASGKTQGTLSRRTTEGRNVIVLRDAVPGGTLSAGLYHVDVSGPGFRKTFRFSWLNP